MFLKAKEENEILLGFPWVFGNEIDYVKSASKDGSSSKSQKAHASLENCALEDGSLVEVFSQGGAFLGSGVLNKKSKIAVRLLGNARADFIGNNAEEFFADKIQAAYDLRKLSFDESDSYRLVFGEADFIPGLIVDRFKDVNGNVYLVIQFLSLSCEVFRSEILQALRAIVHPFGIYERSDAAVRNLEGLDERSGWQGDEKEEVITIRENGVLLEVDLARGQKTGYFLDQKRNREKVACLAKGKRRVLDAFCHTASFALNAVKGGAQEVIAAELSSYACRAAERNVALNKAEDKISVIQADAFDALRKFEEEVEAAGDECRFDMIILDPPAFTKNAKNIDKAYGGYKEINMRAMRLLKAGGILVSCSCSAFFDGERFYGMLMKAASDANRKVQVIEKSGAAPDHPILLGYSKSEYLKCAVCRVL